MDHKHPAIENRVWIAPSLSALPRELCRPHHPGSVPQAKGPRRIFVKDGATTRHLTSKPICGACPAPQEPRWSRAAFSQSRRMERHQHRWMERHHPTSANWAVGCWETGAWGSRSFSSQAAMVSLPGIQHRTCFEKHRSSLLPASARVLVLPNLARSLLSQSPSEKYDQYSSTSCSQ